MRNNIQKTQKKNEQILAAKMVTHFSGPLPPPAEMERYEAICPGFAEKLMERYIKQSDHRMSLESKVIDSDIKNSARGQIFAFILALTTILIGGLLIYLNKTVIGIVSILGALSAVVGVFVYGNESKKNERIKKSQENPEI